jgi:ATPase subunit of ABC transporter with duplicated ATPase domains
MSEITFGSEVSLKQAAAIILATPENRYLLRGEPGIGKSSLLKMLSLELPDHEVAYIDVPNMDLGDIAMPVIDHETKTTRYYPNARFKIHTGKPTLTMLDEYTKGSEPVKNMLHPMLEVANPRLGDISMRPKNQQAETCRLTSSTRISCLRGRASLRTRLPVMCRSLRVLAQS